MLRITLISLVSVGLFACGGGQATPSRGVSTAQALTGTAEWLEFEPAPVRVELFREVARVGAQQAGSRGAVLFPQLVDGEFVAAPTLEPGIDLLGPADAGASFDVRFDARSDRFSEDRRDAFQGLSEREAAELIARSLLTAWGVKPAGAVTVVRAAGAPYAAAWIDGQLRLNPAFIYMAAAPTR